METRSAGNYTYTLLEKGGKKTWVAYTKMETRIGDKLLFKGCTVMRDFESKSLDKTFDTILFCDAPQLRPVKAKAAAKGQNAAGGKIAVEKAEGPNAYTVADIFTKRGALNHKNVVVKGQVVKVSTGIMKKNWIHLQDGSGSEKDKSNDLVVTTTEVAPEVGAVVTVSGKVVKDKDFGSGYKYKVMIENGSLEK